MLHAEMAASRRPLQGAHRTLQFLRMLASLTLLAFAAHANAEPAPCPHSKPAPTSTVLAPPLEPQIQGKPVKTFMDAWFTKHLKDYVIPGAVVVVVENGRIIFSEGYGRADPQQEIKPHPATTPFRLASISKVLTATAVMQLVECGKLDLDTDVNHYLRKANFQIPDTFPGRPVTLRHLLTHSAGFEVNAFGGGYVRAKDNAALVSLEHTVTRHLPARVRPPVKNFQKGIGAAYSNWSLVLAGYIVELVAEMPFDDYMDEHIFKPLGMTRSTFREDPYPFTQQPVGYAQGEAQAFEFYHGIAPASSLTSTAHDFAQFMMAHLQHGELNGRRILSETSARTMHERGFSVHPDLNGAGLVFWEERLNGQRLLAHDGISLNFTSEFFLIPEQDLGVFVAYNTRIEDLIGCLTLDFMDAFFSGETGARRGEDLHCSNADEAVSLAEYAGSYVATSRSLRTWEKLYGPLNAAFEVSVTGDDALAITVPFGEEEYWVEAAKNRGVFHPQNRDEGDSFDTIVFAPDESGRMHLLEDNSKVFASFERLTLFETQIFNGILLIVCCISFLVAVIIGITVLLRQNNQPGHKTTTRLNASIAIINLSILTGLIYTISQPPEDLMLALPPTLLMAMGLSLLSAILSPLFLILVLHGSMKRQWPVATSLRLIFQAVIAVVFVGWLVYWQVIGKSSLLILFEQ